MDINELLEDKDNGLIPLDGRSYDIAAYAGQLRQARNIAGPNSSLHVRW